MSVKTHAPHASVKISTLCMPSSASPNIIPSTTLSPMNLYVPLLWRLIMRRTLHPRNTTIRSSGSACWVPIPTQPSLTLNGAAPSNAAHDHEGARYSDGLLFSPPKAPNWFHPAVSAGKTLLVLSSSQFWMIRSLSYPTSKSPQNPL